MTQPGFYFCLCPDPYLAREQAERIIHAAFTGEEPPERYVFWADEGLDSRFWDTLTLQGFISANRAIIVRSAHTLNAENWKKLSAALSTPRNGIFPLFFLESLWEKGAPKLPAHIGKLRCLEFATRQNWIWKSPPLDGRTLPSYIRKAADARQLKIEPDVLEYICACVAPDACAVHSLLDMLTLFTTDGILTASMLSLLTKHSPDLIIFDLIRHLQGGKSSEVWKSLLQEEDGGEALLFPFLALMAREARLLWQMQAGENVYFPQNVMAFKRSLVSRLGPKGLGSIFQMLAEAEWAVKSGRRQPRQALEELVASLTRIFSPSPHNVI